MLKSSFFGLIIFLDILPFIMLFATLSKSVISGRGDLSRKKASGTAFGSALSIGEGLAVGGPVGAALPQ